MRKAFARPGVTQSPIASPLFPAGKTRGQFKKSQPPSQSRLRLGRNDQAIAPAGHRPMQGRSTFHTPILIRAIYSVTGLLGLSLLDVIQWHSADIQRPAQNSGDGVVPSGVLLRGEDGPIAKPGLKIDQYRSDNGWRRRYNFFSRTNARKFLLQLTPISRSGKNTPEGLGGLLRGDKLSCMEPGPGSSTARIASRRTT